METKPRTWLTAREAADYLNINYPRFTRLANKGHIPRTLIEGTKRTYRYKTDLLDRWMLDHQEG